MTDSEVAAEIEANEARVIERKRIEQESEPGGAISEAIGSLFSPVAGDRLDEDEEAARRAENDADQRPE